MYSRMLQGEDVWVEDGSGGLKAGRVRARIAVVHWTVEHLQANAQAMGGQGSEVVSRAVTELQSESPTVARQL